MTGKSISRILIETFLLVPIVVTVFLTLILTCRSPHLFLGPQGALGPVTVTVVTTFFFLAVADFVAWDTAQALPVGATRTAATARDVTVFLSNRAPLEFVLAQ
jgi:hypothetical protein